ncbi:uncharacterized protein LOC119102525 [Pollicipes pollicipes]|uniref:uncharacterized protein LOC119102525 n=1 Tax=Pollicipes pollicipes TaxID=41117 RepID=UPI001884EA48|nr:uncharacterized protein LOC119102525 [Pollicipes pollicipes]
MRLGTMTAIVVLLVSATSGSEGSGVSDLEEVGLSSHSPSTGSQHRIRHRHAARRRAQQERRQLAVDEPLPLPDDLQESAEDPELEDGRQRAALRYADPAADFTVCCPAKEERTSPHAGTRRDGSLAFLYSDADFKQMFFERSCREQTDEEVALVRRLVRRRFRCVQEYSYSYAVYDVNGAKMLDFIRIRSGCRCEIKQRSNRRKKKRKWDRKQSAAMRRRYQKRRRRAQRGGQSQTNARTAS